WSNRFPSLLVLPRFERRRAPEGWKRIAEQEPVLTSGIFPKDRVALRHIRSRFFFSVVLDLAITFPPDHFQAFKVRSRLVPNTETFLVSFQFAADFQVRRDQVMFAGYVGKIDVSREPGGAFAGHFG